MTFHHSTVRLAIALTVLAFVPEVQAQQNTARNAERFRIAGTVVSATTGSALPQTRVTITDVKNPSNTQSVVTSEEGRFEFDGIPAGKYSMQGARRGFITAAYDQHQQFSTAIVTGAGVDTEHLAFRLTPDAVLSGTVTDESGDPLRNAQVNLYRETHGAGVTRIVRSEVTQTDDQGTFEFAPLNVGNYFVSVTTKPWYAVHPAPRPVDGDNGGSGDRSLDVAYATTYYGDVTEADDATPIPLKGGDRISIEVHLTPVPALHFLFHVNDAEHGFSMPMLQKRVFDSTQQIQGEQVQQVSQGTYELSGIAPGRYTVRMPVEGANGQYTQAVDTDLTEDGQEMTSSAGEPQSSVKIIVQDRAKLPQQLAVALQNKERRTVGYQLVQNDAELKFENLDPGTYTIVAGSPNKSYSVVGISSGQSTNPGHSLNVPAGSSLEVSIRLIGGEVELDGVAQLAGKPAPGAMIVLIPDRPESNRELFRRDQSDLDGSFVLRSVIPGTYTVAAIENGWDLDWSQPGGIAVYAKHGRKVTITDGAEGKMQIASVEVQPR